MHRDTCGLTAASTASGGCPTVGDPRAPWIMRVAVVMATRCRRVHSASIAGPGTPIPRRRDVNESLRRPPSVRADAVDFRRTGDVRRSARNRSYRRGRTRLRTATGTCRTGPVRARSIAAVPLPPRDHAAPTIPAPRDRLVPRSQRPAAGPAVPRSRRPLGRMTPPPDDGTATAQCLRHDGVCDMTRTRTVRRHTGQSTRCRHTTEPGRAATR
jgi:hypothetical protein